MTDTEYATTTARIGALADLWLPCLGLKDAWHIAFRYFRDSGEYAMDKHGESYDRESVAYASVSWAYLDALITFNVPRFVVMTPARQEEAFVHELCHVLIHEMRAGTRCDCEYDIRHEERVCTMLARAFVWTKEHFSRTADPEKTCTPQKGAAQDAG